MRQKSLSSVIRAAWISCIGSEIEMNKDRIIGSAKQVKGTVEGVTGRILGDAKLCADGKLDVQEGKIQNALGGIKDSVTK